MADWPKAAGTIIAGMGKDIFARNLSTALQEIAVFDYTVVFGYLGSARPIDLYDNFPKTKRKIMVEDYQVGPYLLDPFYLASVTAVEPGLYRLRDLAPDRFYQGEYFRNYYVQTGLAEEICYIINLPEAATVCVSLMRSEKAFSAREFRELGKAWPLVSEACRNHWHELAKQFGQKSDRDGPARGRIPNVDEAFEKFDEGLLTPREKEVVEYTLKGHSADAVGRILGISSGTVRIHRRNIYSKLRIRSQGELFSRFIDALLGPGRDS
ncbi:helix-turn-helix transcriptional regulator [Rhodovibrionaceae bacterium A322]